MKDDLISTQPETHEKCTETHACDCISRQAAIDAIKALWNDAPSAQHVSAMFDCEDAIRALPSAQSEPEELDFLQPHKKIGVRLEIGQPEQQWIPCSERLPKQQQTVLIQDFGQITIGYLNAESRWRDLTNFDDYLKGVVAWMPLPEPYTERREG